MTSPTLPRSIRTHLEQRLSFLPAAAFILTTTFVLLAHLSPAALFPHLAKYNIMVWLAVAATLACLPQLLFHPLRFRSPQVYLMLGLTAAVPVSLIANGQAGGALRGLREFLVSGIVFFLVLAAVDTVRKMRVLAFVVVISAVYLLSQSLYGWYSNGLQSQYVYRQHIYNSQQDVIGEFPRLQSVGFLEDPNAFAQYLLVAVGLLTLAWGLGRWQLNLKGNLKRNLALVLLPSAYLLYGVLVTHSRGGLVGVAILVFFLLEKRVGKIISLVLAGGLLRCLFWMGAAGPRAISLADPATAGRIEIAQKSIEMSRSSPLFGVGFHMFGAHNLSSPLTAHNSLLLCLAELGIFGTLFWLGLIVFSILDLNRILRNDIPPTKQAAGLAGTANAVRIALFTFFGTALFLSQTYAMTLFLLLGMAAAARQLFPHRSGAG
jgi:putative inorganic carbon (HCO3(-)) transporter